MKRQLTMIAAGALVALLAACSALQTANAPVSAVDLNKAAYAARATYVGALTVMAQIVVLPRCERAPAPCIPQAAVDTMRKAELDADRWTQAGEDAARSTTIDTTALALAVNNASRFANVFKTSVDTWKKGN